MLHDRGQNCFILNLVSVAASSGPMTQFWPMKIKKSLQGILKKMSLYNKKRHEW